MTRYVTPLREGGSLPAIVEADDDGLYVLKFRGAGHGARALIAELVSGEIARALGLPVPEIVFAELDADLARTEPDPEIYALISKAVEEGCSILLVTSDFEELSRVADRAIVLSGGRVTAELRGTDIEPVRLTELAFSTQEVAS